MHVKTSLVASPCSQQFRNHAVCLFMFLRDPQTGQFQLSTCRNANQPIALRAETNVCRSGDDNDDRHGPTLPKKLGNGKFKRPVVAAGCPTIKVIFIIDNRCNLQAVGPPLSWKLLDEKTDDRRLRRYNPMGGYHLPSQYSYFPTRRLMSHR